jgi:hypothetical protein
MTGWKGFNEFGNPRGAIINNQKYSLEEFGSAARTHRELGFWVRFSLFSTSLLLIPWCSYVLLDCVWALLVAVAQKTSHRYISDSAFSA